MHLGIAESFQSSAILMHVNLFCILQKRSVQGQIVHMFKHIHIYMLNTVGVCTSQSSPGRKGMMRKDGSVAPASMGNLSNS